MTEAPVTPNAPAPKASSGGRIIALDVMRGYFILLIASVHLHYYPSLLGLFDGRGQLWVSEAEGFFFISGLLIGIIRRRDMLERGFKTAAAKLWRRAAKLYAASLVLCVLYLCVANLTSILGIAGAKAGFDRFGDPIGLIIRIVTLQYSYGWADFLIYYVGFLLIAPVLLWLLAKRAWWLVILIVAGIWTARWHQSFGTFDPFMQWQCYFFSGSIIGFYWPGLQRAFGRLKSSWRKTFRIGAASLAVLIYIAGMITVFIPQHYSVRLVPSGWWGSIVHSVQHLASDNTFNLMLLDGRVGLLRPLVWLIVFAGAYTLVRRFEPFILKWTGWLLVPFGSNSLYVYISESILLFIVPFITLQRGYVVNSLIELVIVAVVWLAVRRRFLFAIIPR